MVVQRPRPFGVIGIEEVDVETRQVNEIRPGVADDGPDIEDAANETEQVVAPALNRVRHLVVTIDRQDHREGRLFRAMAGRHGAADVTRQMQHLDHGRIGCKVQAQPVLVSGKRLDEVDRIVKRPALRGDRKTRAVPFGKDEAEKAVVAGHALEGHALLFGDPRDPLERAGSRIARQVFARVLEELPAADVVGGGHEGAHGVERAEITVQRAGQDRRELPCRSFELALCFALEVMADREEPRGGEDHADDEDQHDEITVTARHALSVEAQPAPQCRQGPVPELPVKAPQANGARSARRQSLTDRLRLGFVRERHVPASLS